MGTPGQAKGSGSPLTPGQGTANQLPEASPPAVLVSSETTARCHLSWDMGHAGLLPLGSPQRGGEQVWWVVFVCLWGLKWGIQ